MQGDSGPFLTSTARAPQIGGPLASTGRTVIRASLELLRQIAASSRDLAPIFVVVAFFQIAVLRQPLPDAGDLLLGALLVMAGLALFLRGLAISLFPLGEAMADAFATKGSALWLFAFAFALGFATTAAEPSLTAVAHEAARVAASAGAIADDNAARDSYALALRLTVAVSVGAALVLGVLRILRGWPLPWLILGGYGVVIAVTAVAPPEIIAVAYDSGGVTTSTITVPLVTALGVGLAGAIRGRSPLVDGFGLIALASLTPILFVMVFGIVLHG